jgi:hypothetical protein
VAHYLVAFYGKHEVFVNVAEVSRTFGSKKHVDLLIKLFYLNVLTPEVVEGLLRFDYMIILNVLEGLVPKQRIQSERATVAFDFFEPQPKFNAESFDEALLNRRLISGHS